MHIFTPLLLISSAAAGWGEQSLRCVSWNVESEGNAPAVIAQQLAELRDYDLYALTEVDPVNFERYGSAICTANCRPYRYLRTVTGNKDRMMIIYDTTRLHLRDHYELVAHDGIRMNDVSLRYRSPLVAEFRDLRTGVDFVFTVNHLARGKAEFRQQQARGLRRWASGKQVPLIAMGDYNFDYEFRTQRGNAGFDEFLADSVWKWVRPSELLDTNWYDPQPDGEDDYPDSMLDFAFVAGQAIDWHATSRVVVRDGDFPDDHQTSDHRPIELLISPTSPATSATDWTRTHGKQ